MKYLYLFCCCLLAFTVDAFPQMEVKQDRILVVSGGGARGAYAAGILNRIHEDLEYDYAAAFGTSTGSLIAPLALLNEHDKLKTLYTTSKQKDILDRNLMNKAGTKLRGWPIFKAVIFGKKSIAGSKKLRKLLLQNYSEADHVRIDSLGKEFFVTTVSLETTRLKYRASSEYDYDDMVDWIWASANQPVFMTAYEKSEIVEITEFENGCDSTGNRKERIEQHWVDGGLKENIPLRRAVEYGMENNLKNIDVIVLGNAKIDTQITTPDIKRKKFNVVDQLLRTIDAFSYEAAKNDIESGFRLGGARDMFINVYYISPEFVNESSLNFNNKRMKKMWESGNAFECSVESYYIDEEGQPSRIEFKYEDRMEPKLY